MSRGDKHHEHHVETVQNLLPEATVLIPARSDLQINGCLSVSSKCLHSLLASARHAIDLSKIFFITTALLSEWLRQLFDILEKYGHAPSEEIQETWLGFYILGAATLLSAVAKIANHCFSTKIHYFSAQDKYLFPVLSSAYVFFILQLFVNEENLKALPLLWFSVISAASMFGAIAVSLKCATPHTGDHLIFRLRDLQQLSLSRFPAASKEERMINALNTIKKTACALATLACTIGRELKGKTEALAGWENALLALLSIPGAGKIGFELTHHPKFFHSYEAFLNLIDHGALTYQTLSGIFSLIIAYTCSDETYCLNISREGLSYICFAISLCIGLHAAASTHTDFDHKHQSIEEYIKIRNATFCYIKGSIVAGCSFLPDRISSMLKNATTRTNDRYEVVL